MYPGYNFVNKYDGFVSFGVIFQKIPKLGGGRDFFFFLEEEI